MHFRAFSLLVVACVMRAHPSAGEKRETDQRLSREDEDFCKGSVQLSYPDVNIKSCMVVPLEFREKISREWGAPRVQMATADTNAKYVLLMVDPDAPSRTDATRAYWRHWLMADIEGSALKAGHIKGTVLSDYTPPTPPKRTGFHRYQIMLYEQPAGQVLSLNEQEKSSLGKWDPQAFVEKFGLVGPVASLQFLTQNYKD